MIYRRLPLLLATALLLPALALATPLADKVVEHRLANGLRLLLVERHDTPTVAAYITIGVGSVHETSETRGVAHLLEHMLFKGTTTLGTTDYAAEKAAARPDRTGRQRTRWPAPDSRTPIRPGSPPWKTA